MKIRLLLILTMSAITACGFHLRGSQNTVATHLNNVYVLSVAATMVTSEVRSQLQLAGALSNAAEQAELTLKIENESFERTVLSVSANTGKAEEFELTLNVVMSVSTKDGRTVVVNETVTVRRDYVFDEDAVLGKFTEETVLKENMTQQAASQIIRRLNAAVKNI